MQLDDAQEALFEHVKDLLQLFRAEVVGPSQVFLLLLDRFLERPNRGEGVGVTGQDVLGQQDRPVVLLEIQAVVDVEEGGVVLDEGQVGALAELEQVHRGHQVRLLRGHLRRRREEAFVGVKLDEEGIELDLLPLDFGDPDAVGDAGLVLHVAGLEGVLGGDVDRGALEEVDHL